MPKTYAFEFEAPPEQLFQETLGAVNVLGFSILESDDGTLTFNTGPSIFSNAGHAYVDVAGLRLDTSAADDPTRQQGPRWRPLRRNNVGYTVRHPLGY